MSNSNRDERPTIAFVVTFHSFVGFYEGQLEFLVRNGWYVDVVSSPGPKLQMAVNEGAKSYAIPMEREIAPLKDVVSLFRLWIHFLHTRPDLVVTGTPKAGLLGSLAARLAAVPHVVYTVHGLRLETTHGLKCAVLWCAEWVACHAAHRVHSVSPSLRSRMISLRLASAGRAKVIGPGTVNGVDCERWRCTPRAVMEGRKTREHLGIPIDARVIGFVGRLTRDKGVAVLYEAFTRLHESNPDARLLLVGPFEDGDPVPLDVREHIANDHRVVTAGYSEDVAPYYWAMDVLALPSYREGFSVVCLEAQAASVPVVSTDATGAIDGFVDGVTGLRIAVGDVNSLASALQRLLDDPDLRASMGHAGREWVRHEFPRETVWSSYLAEYLSMVDVRERIPDESLISQ